MSTGLGRTELTVLALVEDGSAWTVREVCEAIREAGIMKPKQPRATTVQRAFRTLYQKGEIHLRFSPVLMASQEPVRASQPVKVRQGDHAPVRGEVAESPRYHIVQSRRFEPPRPFL
jgi:hypothetical protein